MSHFPPWIVLWLEFWPLSCSRYAALPAKAEKYREFNTFRAPPRRTILLKTETDISVGSPDHPAWKPSAAPLTLPPHSHVCQAAPKHRQFKLFRSPLPPATPAPMRTTFFTTSRDAQNSSPSTISRDLELPAVFATPLWSPPSPPQRQCRRPIASKKPPAFEFYAPAGRMAIIAFHAST